MDRALATGTPLAIEQDLAWPPIATDNARLRHVVGAAHRAGLWIRFCTLNGHSAADGERLGLTSGYNFGSIDAARIRWRAAIDAGVEFIATDQYEEFAHISSP